jgi:tRNA pseudouridine38-40 synthase
VEKACRIKAIIEYDGSRYKGFQIQPHEPTVQGSLERGLEAIAGRHIRVSGAGRTDTGVHARGQVAHFDICWRHPISVLARAWNAKLPDDIAVRDLEAVDDDFHARFSASSREYRYTLYRGGVASPLCARNAHHVRRPVNVTAMAEAARFLCGEHDFAAFGRPPHGENTVRVVYRAVFRQSGDMIWFDIKGNAFLRRMVRLIMGTLVAVGQARLTPQGFREILLSKEINHPMATVSPGGLCLMRVNYARR